MTNDFVVVFSTELMRRLRSRPFQIGVIIGIFGILAFTKLPGLIGNAFDDSGARIVLAGEPALVARAAPLLRGDYKIAATVADPSEPTVAQLAAHDATSWVTLARGAHGDLHFTLYSREPKSQTGETIANDLTPLNVALATALPHARVRALLNVAYTVHGVGSKFASAVDATAAWTVSYALLMLLYILILINSQMVMSSVAEEKTSRIAELLVASISPTPLLYGKIAAATVTGMVQLAIWAAAGTFFGSSGHAQAAASGGPDFGALLSGSATPAELIAFVVLFILGFLQYSMLFAAIGSLINRTEDLGSISFPIILPVIVGLFLAMGALGAPDAGWAVATSFVPLVSPFVLFARIAMSEVPIWQIALALAINVAAAWAIAALAGKLYRVGMLLYGRPPSLKQIWAVVTS